MKIGLLIIASEILDGKISDSNTRYLAGFLGRHNLELQLTLTVRDSEPEIHSGLSILMNACDVIVTSGGLGPTRDDLTKSALASYLRRQILYSEEAHKTAAGNYERFGRTFAGKEHGYAWLPTGFKALSNSAGLAPGLLAEHLGRHVIAAPGVPREFHAIIEEHLAPWLASRGPENGHIENFNIRTKRMPEEKIFKELDPALWDRLSAIGDVCSLPMMMGVDIGVKIRAQDETELQQKKEEVLRIIESSPLLPYVWHYGHESLEEVIVKNANEKSITYGFAESATGGLCSHKVTSVSGSSQTFMGSVVSYDTSVKTGLLGVPDEVVSVHGVVSVETAEAMALGLQKTLKVKAAVSITGIAGPSGGTEENPVGTVCVGVAIGGKVSSARFRFFGDRQMLKERFAQLALVELLEHMEHFA